MFNLVYDSNYLKLQDYIGKSFVNRRICRLFIILISLNFLMHAEHEAHHSDPDITNKYGEPTLSFIATHDEWWSSSYKEPVFNAAGLGVVGLAYYALSCHKQQRVLENYIQKNHEKKSDDFAHQYALKYDKYSKPIRDFNTQEQCDIMAEYALYQFEGYREFIKTLPDYPVYIKGLYKRLSTISTANQKEVMPGFSGGQLYDVVNGLNREVYENEHRAKLVEQVKKEQILRNVMKAQHTQLVEYLKTALQEMAYACAEDRERIEHLHSERQKALEDLDTLEYFTNGYSIPVQAQQVLIEYGYDPRIFNDCFGGAIHHRLHCEFITALNDAVALHVVNGDLKALLRTVVEISYAGCQENKNGNVWQAMQAVDFCWDMLAYIKKERKDRPIYMGIIDGTAQAGKNLGHAICHPVQTAVGFGVGYGVLKLAKIPAKILAESTLFAACPPLYPAIKAVSLAHTAYQAIETIKLVGERPTSRDVTREIVCFGLEYFAYGALIDKALPAGTSAARKTGAQLKNALQDTAALFGEVKPPVPTSLPLRAAEGAGEVSIKFSSFEPEDLLKPKRGSGGGSNSGDGGATAREVARLAKLQSFEAGVDDLVKKYGENAVNKAKEAFNISECKILNNEVAETLNTLEQLAADAKRGTESKSHRANFANDSAHGGKVTVCSIGEGITACAAEDQEFFKQLTRAVETSVDFIDETLRCWDVKSAASVRTGRAKHNFKVEKFVHLVTGALEKGENVLIDITCLNEADLGALSDKLNKVLPTDLGGLKILYLHRNDVFSSVFFRG